MSKEIVATDVPFFVFSESFCLEQKYENHIACNNEYKVFQQYSEQHPFW